MEIRNMPDASQLPLVLVIDDEVALDGGQQHGDFLDLFGKLPFQYAFHDGSAAGDSQYSVQSALDWSRLRLTRAPDLVLLDLQFGSDPNLGVAILRELKGKQPDLPVIILTKAEEQETLEECARLGCRSYLLKWKGTVNQMESLFRLCLGLESDIPELFGTTDAMRRLRANIERIARSPGKPTVLISGESGTGKTLSARIVWKLGRYAYNSNAVFFRLDCATVSESLLDRELFGHVRGAFTGADRDRAGYLEASHSGVLFLDNIHNMSLGMQRRLLSFLEDGAFRRVGDTASRTVDVQVIAATNQDLKQLVTAGLFIEELYNRFDAFHLQVVPLRARKADVGPLAKWHLDVLRGKGYGLILGLDRRTQGLLEDYHWPGNVRELFNVLEEACSRARAGLVLPEHLPQKITVGTPQEAGKVALPDEGLDLERHLAVTEAQFIEAALERTNGNQRQAQRLLYPSRQGIYLRRQVERIARDTPQALDHLPRVRALVAGWGEGLPETSNLVSQETFDDG